MPDRLTIIDRIVRNLARKRHLLADPDLYVRCDKRVPNPAVYLTERNLRNCTLLPSREEMLKHMPKGGICAEVGVAQGYYSRLILDICAPSKLYMIEYDSECANNLMIKFANEIEKGQAEVLHGDSVEMLSKLPDRYLDFVYLDATHDYEHPKSELNICKDKVKRGGIIAGHDYTRFSVWESVQYGVVEAVNEFVVNNDCELVYYTMDMLHSNPSYALKKMTDH